MLRTLCIALCATPFSLATPAAPPTPSISCGVNNKIACPLPTWTPTWKLDRSTVIQPCNDSGWYDPAYAAKWGMVSFDWSNAKALWLAVSPHDCEERLVTQCKKIKAIDPTTKCFVYRNTELALEWLSSQRAVMQDPSRAGYFLQFQNDAKGKAAAKCKAAGGCSPPKKLSGGFCCPHDNIYCENQTPWKGEQQYFWDFRNTSMQYWFVKTFFLGKNGASNKHVDGCFSDDVGGLPEEHGNAIARMGYTPAQTTALQKATQETWQKAVEALAKAGGYNWQMFGNSDGAGKSPQKANCAAFMTEMCAAPMQKRPLMMGAGDAKGGTNTSLAAFLVARPPYAYIGYGWQGCGPASPKRDTWNPLFDMDVGEPVAGAKGLCQQGPKGVFSRVWTKGTSSIDCNTFTASLPFDIPKKPIK